MSVSELVSFSAEYVKYSFGRSLSVRLSFSFSPLLSGFSVSLSPLSLPQSLIQLILRLSTYPGLYPAAFVTALILCELTKTFFLYGYLILVVRGFQFALTPFEVFNYDLFLSKHKNTALSSTQSFIHFQLTICSFFSSHYSVFTGNTFTFEIHHCVCVGVCRRVYRCTCMCVYVSSRLPQHLNFGETGAERMPHWPTNQPCKAGLGNTCTLTHSITCMCNNIIMSSQETHSPLRSITAQDYVPQISSSPSHFFHCCHYKHR